MEANPILPLSLTVALLFAALPATAWVPVSCTDRTAEIAAARERVGKDRDFRAAWERHEQRVRRAEAGDPEYVPHPYPATPKQVFADFRHAFESKLVQDREAVRPRHREVLDALDDGTLRYEVTRIENWAPDRCRGAHRAAFYHLVRLYRGDGREVARAALHENGLFAIYASLDGDQGPLEDLASIGEIVHQRFGVETRPSSAQYVTASGLPVPCSPVMPCVAFRSGGRTFVVIHDFFLFAIDPDAPELGVLESARNRPDPRTAPLSTVRTAAPWITVGFGLRQGRLVATGPRGGPLE